MKQDMTSFDQISRIAQGHAAFQLLWAGVNLGLFQILSKSPEKDLTEMSMAMNLALQPTKILLQGLASLGLVSVSHERYSCSPLALEYLLPDSPHNLIDVLGWQYHIVYPGIVDLTESLRQNKNVGLRHFNGTEDDLYARLTHDKRLERVFQNAMSSLSNLNNRHLAEHADLSAVSHLVDAGGGAGTNAITLCRKFPHLKITIFDSPSICRMATKNIVDAGLTERIFTHPGDLFKTSFPGGIDGVLLSHMLTIWAPEQNIALLTRIHHALPNGGKVFVFNMMTNDDGIGPISCTLGSVYFMSIATGRGMLYSWGEQTAFLRAAGFNQITRQTLPLDHGLLVGTKSL